MTPSLTLIAAWIFSCISTAGSLFFSEVMHYPPCTLCWYQRVCMYPLVVVLIPAVLKFDKAVLQYALPLAGIGTAVSVYHNLVYVGIIPESLAPCSMGISCKTQFIKWFGVLDIPQLSLIGFLNVLGSLLLTWRLNEE